MKWTSIGSNPHAVTASVQPHQTERSTFFGDLQIPPDALVAHNVRIDIIWRALRQQRQVDLRSVPVGVVRKDDVRAGLPHDAVEPLSRVQPTKNRDGASVVLTGSVR